MDKTNLPPLPLAADMVYAGMEVPRELKLPRARYYTAEQMREYAARAVREAVPDGWALVPREPTPDMLNAAGTVNNYDVDAGGRSDDDHTEWWKAMLAAAPTPAEPLREGYVALSELRERRTPEQQAKVDEARDTLRDALADVKCSKCGQSTMHIGSVCYACSHPDTSEPLRDAGAVAEDLPDIKLRRFREGGWGVRIGDGAIPEIFNTPQEALDAAIDNQGIAHPAPQQPDEAAAEKLRGLLEVAVCPNKDIGCDGEQYPVGDPHRDFHGEQCQWCYERRAALTAAQEKARGPQN